MPTLENDLQLVHNEQLLGGIHPSLHGGRRHPCNRHWRCCLWISVFDIHPHLGTEVLRSSILLSVPITSPHHTFTSPAEIVWFLKIYLSDLLLSVCRLAESSTLREVNDCLRQCLDCHYMPTLRKAWTSISEDSQSGNPLLYAFAAFHQALAASFCSLHFSRHSASLANASPASLNSFSSLYALAACW